MRPLLFLLLILPASMARPPHIVLLMADDLGWNDVSYHGGEIPTPNIDRLARGGLQLESFYAQAVCMPSRAALMTGRYPMRHGLVFGNRYADGEPGLRRDVRLLPEYMQRLGYRTAILGKWHLGVADGYRPEQRGFDYQYGGYLGSLDYFTHRRRAERHWFRNGKPLHEEGYLTDLVADEATRLIGEHEPSKPLFLYVPFNAPHVPLQAPEDELMKHANIKGKKRRTYAAMVTRMDTAIGRIVEALEARDMQRDTLIVFLSDNGASISDGGNNDPYASGKTSPREGGVRVPCVFYWPGTLKPGTNHKLAHIVDLLPTLTGRAEGEAELPKDLDGRDLWAMLTGPEASPHEELLLAHNHRTRALRRGDWKLIVRKLPEERTLLFNIADDPGEKQDRAGEQRELVKQLRERLERYTPPPPRTGIQKGRKRRP